MRPRCPSSAECATLVADGMVAGGTQRNHAFVSRRRTDLGRCSAEDGTAAACRRRRDRRRGLLIAVAPAIARGRTSYDALHRARHARRRLDRRPSATRSCATVSTRHRDRRRPRSRSPSLTNRDVGKSNGMTSIPSSASSCWRGLAPSDERSSRPLRNRPIIGMLCTSYCCAIAGSSSMLTLTTL